MTDNLQFVTTDDGSKTIYNTFVGENYHSKHGALQESKHVFLKSGLEFYLEKTKKQEVSILEVGFGTGLNFLLTADYCTQNNLTLNYTGIEAYPLSVEMINQTGYKEYVSIAINESFLAVYENAFDQMTSLNKFCNFEVAVSKLENFATQRIVDIIYYDAFAAIHQPEMWTDKALERCCNYLKPGGVFVTYAITGNLKRSMKALGFQIEKAPGAPGKREMLRAIKI